MTNTAVRYLTMLRLVPRSPKIVTTKELSTRLSERGLAVCVRSIQRDLEKLSAYFPLISDESQKPYGWSFDRNATTDMIPALDLPAALTFELARAYLSPLLPTRALTHLAPHFEESRRRLNQANSDLGQWPDRVRVIGRGLGGERPPINADVLEIATEALLRSIRCLLVYRARKWPQPEEICVHPLGLVFREPHVYLIGKIEGRDGVRQIVLHRALSGKLIDEPVVPPVGFDLDDYIHSGAMRILKSRDPIGKIAD